ncbi:MAG: phosphoribosylanthranilate isomerase [Deltaproteobacteria bacterium]|nr:phosphoribosylanthranilate isomerase [Deltaproteobacteria bacterium]
MSPTHPPLVKICGITQKEDARAAALLGADMVGFIFHHKSPRSVDFREVLTFQTYGAQRVGVFVDQKGEEIRDICEKTNLTLAQFHGAQDQNDSKIVGPEKVIRVLWPEKYQDLKLFKAELLAWESLARWILIDAGVSGGGHGQQIKSDLLVPIIKDFRVPVLLAGGLNPLNIQELCPPRGESVFAGFDFNSGVEISPGKKDHNLMKKVITYVKSIKL